MRRARLCLPADALQQNPHEEPDVPAMGISPDTPERVKARQEREQQIIDEIDPLDLKQANPGDIHKFITSLPEDCRQVLTDPLPWDELQWDEISDRRTASRIQRDVSAFTPASRRQQIYIFNQIVEVDEVYGVTLNERSRVFRISAAQYTSFINSYVRFLNRGNQAPGRPHLITPEIFVEMLDLIRQSQRENTPQTIGSLCDWIYNKHKVPVSKRYLRQFVSTHHEELMIHDVKAIEPDRAEVSDQELAQYFTLLNNELRDVRPDLIFNMDESGFSRRCRPEPIRAVLACDSNPEKCRYVPKKEDNTMSVVACIALSGDVLKPLVVIQNKTVNAAELGENLRIGHDLELMHNESGFVNTEIVHYWYERIFLPALEEKRAGGNDKAVLIFDGFGAHLSEELMADAASKNIVVIRIPAHSSHLTQALDQFFFANMKRYYAQHPVNKFDIRDRMLRKVMNIMRAYHYAASVVDVRRSWRAVGITCTWNERGEWNPVEVDGREVVDKNPGPEVPRPSAVKKGKGRKRTKVDAVNACFANSEHRQLQERGQCPLCKREERDKVRARLEICRYEEPMRHAKYRFVFSYLDEPRKIEFRITERENGRDLRPDELDSAWHSENIRAMNREEGTRKILGREIMSALEKVGETDMSVQEIVDYLKQCSGLVGWPSKSNFGEMVWRVLIELVECKLVERLAKQEGTESEFNLYEARFKLRR